MLPSQKAGLLSLGTDEVKGSAAKLVNEQIRSFADDSIDRNEIRSRQWHSEGRLLMAGAFLDRVSRYKRWLSSEGAKTRRSSRPATHSLPPEPLG